MSRALENQSLLSPLCFDNRFTRELPADMEQRNHRRQVHGACYSRVLPLAATSPRLVACSPEAATLLDLDSSQCTGEEFTRVFSGNQLLAGMDPHAACYGGHQFGNWAGQLGDGRVINLGEILNRRGEHWMLQLKGAGPTPYSRNADGLAVLRSSLREFLCSEAMFHLGIPTTRALSLILTGDTVERDMFYDGHPKEEPGAVVCRLAPSFLRFGSYELHTARNDIETLRILADYTLRHHFSHLGPPSPVTYGLLFSEICRATAELMVHWMRVGFVHGVMNTDNMSILGLTIDYGPYGWLESYDPLWTPNTTDAQGRRYCYGRQPQIAQWNLARLADALLPLIGDTGSLQEGMRAYVDGFDLGIEAMLARKLGLRAYVAESDRSLYQAMLELITEVETDMTLWYWHLAEVSRQAADAEERIRPLLPAFYRPEQLTEQFKARILSWLDRYCARLDQDNLQDQERKAVMQAVNPRYVLRNYLAQQAIDRAEEGDFAMVAELLEVLRNPYDEQPGKEHFAEKRPEWARNRPGCSMLSCSS